MSECKRLGFSDIQPIVVTAPSDAKASEESEAPVRILLIKKGKNSYTIDGEDGEFDVDDEACKKIIANFKKRKNDLVFDYDHATLDPELSAKGSAPAAGWVGDIEETPEGIVAIIKRWTNKALDMIKNKEYAYFSPVIDFDEKGNPEYIHSVALTNHPAIHGLNRLLAANDKSRKSSDPVENIKNEAIVAFQSAASNIKESIESQTLMLHDILNRYEEFIKGDEVAEKELRAFSDRVFDIKVEGEEEMDIFARTLGFADKTLIPSEFKALNAIKNESFAFLNKMNVKKFSDVEDLIEKKNKELKTSKKAFSDLEDKLKRAEAEQIVERYMEEGKITIAQKNSAIELAKTNIKQFNDWVSTLPSYRTSSKKIEVQAPVNKPSQLALTDLEKEWIEKMGINPTDYIKQKQKEIKHGLRN